MVTTVPVEYCPLIGIGLKVKLGETGCAFETKEHKITKTVNKCFFTTIKVWSNVK